ncbi:MAG TPA: endonuclease VII domain-containing protein [Acidimicrobiales bacterium]|nr:endonuclease VII domain-containing protein [Acidimicrobiales bacterium]
MKRCKKCGQWKATSEFYRSAGMRDGYRNDCKVCNLAAKAARYRANPQPCIDRVKRWQQENPDRLNATRRRRRELPEVKRRERAAHLMRKFGITVEQYEEMLAIQGGGCAICGRRPGKISLHVDHDHETGRIRGCLCFRCNNALGDFADNGDWLVAAANYLGPAPKDPALSERLGALKQAAGSGCPQGVLWR